MNRKARLHDWPERLDALLWRLRDQPFAWGKHDCCTVAADAVLAVTGMDPIAQLRGSWAGPRQAVAVLRRAGGLRSAVCSALGEPKPVEYAQRGDPVLLRQAGRDAMGVCIGTQAVAAARVGLARVSMAPARGASDGVLCAWGV
jgi:hypothetical protein